MISLELRLGRTHEDEILRSLQRRKYPKRIIKDITTNETLQNLVLRTTNINTPLMRFVR